MLVVLLEVVVGVVVSLVVVGVVVLVVGVVVSLVVVGVVVLVVGVVVSLVVVGVVVAPVAVPPPPPEVVFDAVRVVFAVVGIVLVRGGLVVVLDVVPPPPPKVVLVVDVLVVEEILLGLSNLSIPTKERPPIIATPKTEAKKILRFFFCNPNGNHAFLCLCLSGFHYLEDDRIGLTPILKISHATDPTLQDLSICTITSRTIRTRLVHGVSKAKRSN